MFFLRKTYNVGHILLYQLFHLYNTFANQKQIILSSVEEYRLSHLEEDIPLIGLTRMCTAH